MRSAARIPTSIVSGSDQTGSRLPDRVIPSGGASSAHRTRERFPMLTKVFPIPLKPGKQAEAETIVEQFAPLGPGQEDGTLSFRVYRDPAKPDYLLFVEHFADQAAYDAHTGSSASDRPPSAKTGRTQHPPRPRPDATL